MNANYLRGRLLPFQWDDDSLERRMGKTEVSVDAENVEVSHG